MYNPENKEQFKVQPKPVFNFDGEQIGTIEQVVLRSLGYRPFDTAVNFYIELQDATGKNLREPFNHSIDVPTDWGKDDMVLIQALAADLKLTLLPWPAPVVEEGEEA
jgi:hypothetical protein